MRTVRVAIAQTSPPSVPTQVLETARGWIARASARGAAALVFPELFFPGFHGLLDARRGRAGLDAFLALAEPVPGPVTAAIGAMAEAARLYIVFTLLERDQADGVVYNTAVLLGPDGSIVHRHRKTMLTPGIEEPGLGKGSEYGVVATGIGRVGLLVCADATCPEGPRLLALRGAEIVCLASGDFVSEWRVNGQDLCQRIWRSCSAAPTRAVDNNLFWIAANSAGIQSDTAFFGNSRIISPMGDVLAEGGFGPQAQELVIADLDLSLRARIAESFSLLARRRPELYGDLARRELEAAGEA